MKQSAKENKMLDELFFKKNSIPYGFRYKSSAVDHKAELGTIEADVSGRFGRWKSEPFRASKLSQMVSKLKDINSILDVGGGNLLAANFFVSQNLKVDVCDFSNSVYLELSKLSESGINEFKEGDFNKINFEKKYDAVWCSHVLEHMPDVGFFLDKLISLVNEDGYIAVAVPPRKPFIVSGHINLFNPGMLVYRFILAGLDCSKAKIFQYDGNICILIKKNTVELPDLRHDVGDLELLRDYFPMPISEGFNGDFMSCNLDDGEAREIFG
jgi:SAM-dependent methyltransferase